MLGWSRMRRALVIVGKAPEPGLAKTRLIGQHLSAQAAAALYRGFLLDTLQLGLGLGWERVTLVHPARAGAAAALAALVPPPVKLRAQGGTGLGHALASAVARHLAEGFQRVVLIGSDTPSLPVELIEAGCLSLDECDVCLGPSSDGGYYLIGLRAAHLGLFERIDWSTDRVYGQTLERARQLGLLTRSLPEWYDVDTLADLDRLRAELVDRPAWVARHTRQALEQLAGLVSGV